jgi:membrane protein implicated in regulation of membrane protease activity
MKDNKPVWTARERAMAATVGFLMLFGGICAFVILHPATAFNVFMALFLFGAVIVLALTFYKIIFERLNDRAEKRGTQQG